jgi:hypothetical protein
MLRNAIVALALILGLSLTASHRAQAQSGACSAGCVQYNTNDEFSASNITVALTGMAAGNSIHAYPCFNGPASITSASVPGAGTAQIGTNLASGGGFSCTLIVVPNVTAGSNTLTINFNTGCAFCAVIAEEWHGDATTAPLDGQDGLYTADGTGGTSLPCSATNITTTGSNDTIEALIQSPDTATAPTVPSGYTIAVNDLSGGFMTTFKTGNAAGTYNPTYLSASGANDNNIVCGGLKQAGGGPSVSKFSGSLNLTGAGN